MWQKKPTNNTTKNIKLNHSFDHLGWLFKSTQGVLKKNMGRVCLIISDLSLWNNIRCKRKKPYKQILWPSAGGEGRPGPQSRFHTHLRPLCSDHSGSSEGDVLFLPPKTWLSRWESNNNMHSVTERCERIGRATLWKWTIGTQILQHLKERRGCQHSNCWALLTRLPHLSVCLPLCLNAILVTLTVSLPAMHGCPRPLLRSPSWGWLKCFLLAGVIPGTQDSGPAPHPSVDHCPIL